MVSVDEIISEHGEFNDNFPQGVCLGKWYFPEVINLVDGDCIEYDAITFDFDGIIKQAPRYRLVRKNGDVTEWSHMISEDDLEAI